MSTITPERAEAPLILSLDIGTSAVRASLFDCLGKAVEGAEARTSHKIRTSIDGAAETDADDLLDLVWRCIDEALARTDQLTKMIAGVASCTFVGNILGVNRADKAVTSLATYADTRAESEVAGLRSDFDEATIHERTGCHFHPSYLPAYFRWSAKATSRRLGNSE